MARYRAASTLILSCTPLVVILCATSGFAEPSPEHVKSFPRALEGYKEGVGLHAANIRVTEELLNHAALDTDHVRLTKKM